MQEVLDALAAFEAPPLYNVPPQVARNLPSFESGLEAVLSDRGEAGMQPVGDISHLLLPALDGTDLVARIYRPLDAGDELLPVLVYFHGGSFVIANLNTYDASCRALANATGCIVASIAYRQAPENPFPTAVDDAYAVTQHFMGAAGETGGDPERVAVGGESAGGNLATVVRNVLPARHGGAARPLCIAPAGRGLRGLPPATMIQAQIDPLQSQGTLYAQAHEQAGVPITSSLYEGVTHEFFGMGQVVDKTAQAVEEAAAGLQSSFGM